MRVTVELDEDEWDTGLGTGRTLDVPVQNIELRAGLFEEKRRVVGADSLGPHIVNEIGLEGPTIRLYLAEKEN